MLFHTSHSSVPFYSMSVMMFAVEYRCARLNGVINIARQCFWRGGGCTAFMPARVHASCGYRR